jgi:DNA repair protein RadA/Sms
VSTKLKTTYRCSECGAESAKWGGRCDACGAWNTIAEEEAADPRNAAPARALRDVTAAETRRWTTGLDEFDFVLGGGIVPGSMVLVGGEPGIGKSTLLLQVAAKLTERGMPVLYASGEESAPQIKLRGDRLGGPVGDVRLVAETNLERVLSVARGAEAGKVLMVDSIQTLYMPEVEGAPGNISQVRECAARLMRFAKETGTAVVVVGHVTKGGGIAGPKTLEHIVDTVLYFEGETTLDHRVLRATKNRFGGVDEIGVFRMTESGLAGVANPSELFLGDRNSAASGSAITTLIEGTRPVLIEIQALATKAGFGTPQRVSTGLDGRRLALLLAVLDKRAGLSFAMLDVFVNIVGGMRLVEPAGDLAVAAALASSVYDRVLPPDAVFIGEVGLGGEIRPVSQVERRLAEAAKMGYTRAFLAERAVPARPLPGMTAIGVPTIHALFQRLFA